MIRLVRSLARLGVLVLGIAVGTVGAASAQPSVSLRGNVGASFFRSPEATSIILNSGTTLGLEAEVRLYRGLAVTVGGTYDRFTLNEDNARLYGQGGGDLTFLGGTLGVRYTFLNGTDAHPYLATGLGWYRGRSSDRREVADTGELIPGAESVTLTQEGVHVAAGSVFRINETYAVFAEPRYVFYDIASGIGGTLRYFTVRLGVDVTL